MDLSLAGSEWPINRKENEGKPNGNASQQQRRRQVPRVRPIRALEIGSFVIDKENAATGQRSLSRRRHEPPNPAAKKKYHYNTSEKVNEQKRFRQFLFAMLITDISFM